MKRLSWLLLAFLAVTGLVGCTQPAAGQVLKSDKPRETAPAVSQAEISALVAGNNDFALRLFQASRGHDGNLFYSPYSVSAALAMTYAGARGDTEKTIAQALCFTLSQDKLHPAFNSLDLQLKQRGEAAQGKDGKGFRLNVVNAIWGQQGFNFLPAYLDILARNYGAGLRVLDFVKETEKSRQTINNWVAAQTEDKIKDLVPPGAINNLTRLVLTNAIYFNAAWAKPFDVKATTSGVFHPLNGGDITVPMMHQSSSFNYYKGNGYQAIELPYDGRQLAMDILLPDAGQYNNFEKSLNTTLLQEITGKLANTPVTLTLPKFQYEATTSLKDALTQLGMGGAFTPAADFSGIDGKRDLLIQDVLHKAFVSVDESGTEAAAATAVIVGVTSIPAQPVTLTVDRPFIFLIRDIPTGAFIFTGRVLTISK